MVDARQDSSLHIYVDLEISCDCCSALVWDDYTYVCFFG
jgi:hypothetical protein